MLLLEDKLKIKEKKEKIKTHMSLSFRNNHC